MSAAARRKATFLVRLWFEPTGEVLPEHHNGWRGSVEHLDSRRCLYFTHVTDLVAFLATETGRSSTGVSIEP